jgi:molybdopterin synthase sulfur carrier subunit
MVDVHLPATLIPLFPGLSRRLDVDASSVDEALGRLEDQWPGLRDRLCDSQRTIRPHIRVYVDREPATLETPLAAGSRLDVIAAISGG